MGNITSTALRQLHNREPSAENPRRSRVNPTRTDLNGPAPKHYVTPDGRKSFIRNEAVSPRKRRSKVRKRWSLSKIVQVCNLRQSAVERLIKGRHNGPCNTDEGETYYAALVKIHVMRWDAMRDNDQNPKPLDTFAWAKKHTPKLAEERPHAWFVAQEDALIAEFGTKPATVPTADEFAQDLGITHGEVVQFKLRSVGAIDRDAQRRQYEEKLADRKRKQREREKAGDVIPHSESLSRTKPWEALGMGRTTYYRKVGNGELPKHPNMRRLNVRQVDPEPKKERDRRNAEARRRALGQKAQSERTKDAELRKLAQELGCGRSTLYRHKDNLEAYVAKRRAKRA